VRISPLLKGTPRAVPDTRPAPPAATRRRWAGEVAGGGARYQPPGLPGAGATRGVFFFLSHCCSHVLSQFTWA
jgi:hypothetical protein